MIKFMNILILYYQKVQCGFRKGFSTQYSLIAMIEKWRKDTDEGNRTLQYRSIGAYGFSYEAKKVMQIYLTYRQHRTKVIDSFSDLIDLLLGVLQGSI